MLSRTSYNRRAIPATSIAQVAEAIPDAPHSSSKGRQWAAAPAEIDRRRNFVIISHPDAGKTTLTEKLLLYGGAIQEVCPILAADLQMTLEVEERTPPQIALGC